MPSTDPITENVIAPLAKFAKDSYHLKFNLNVLLFIIIFFCSADTLFVQANLSANKINNQRMKKYNVLDFGAIGDGKVFDTNAIRKTVNAVAKAGSGTIVFPSNF